MTRKEMSGPVFEGRQRLTHLKVVRSRRQPHATRQIPELHFFRTIVPLAPFATPSLPGVHPSP